MSQHCGLASSTTRAAVVYFEGIWAAWSTCLFASLTPSAGGGRATGPADAQARPAASGSTNRTHPLRADTLTDIGPPEDRCWVNRYEAHVYAEGVKRGGSLVTVRIGENEAARVEAIMAQRSPTDWKQRRSSYGHRAEGALMKHPPGCGRMR